MAYRDESHVHVVGVAGVGMSAVAQALKDAGHEVSGSDRFLDDGKTLDVLACLRHAGIRLTPQDGSAITDRTACIVVSTAIENDNPDLQRARDLGVPVVHRAEMIARLAAGRRLLAITGTAGKTTVTGLIGYLCAEAGLDPVVINGGAVTNWRAPDRVGSVRWGRGSLCIIEADESDKSLLCFQPDYVVITNVSKDHYELDEVIRVFREFRGKAREWSLLGPQAAEVLDGQNMPPVTVRTREHADWFTVDGVEYPSPMCGQHNAENARLAVVVARKLGVPSDKIIRALAGFRGIHRRLEVVARRGGITVFDDYAHNPAKIAASWRAVAERSERVVGIWRPHGFGPLSLLFDELADAFASACRPQDHIFILPVFYAGGTAKKTDDAMRLVEVLKARGVQADHAENYFDLRMKIAPSLNPGTSVLGMGARDPDLPIFLHELLD